MSTRQAGRRLKLPPLLPRAWPAAETDALAVLSRHGRTFRLAGALLPRAMLAEAATLYAFCRHVDDLADHALDPAQARAALLAVRRAVIGHALDQAGEPAPDPAPDPVAGLRALALRRGLDTANAVRLIDTMIGDLGRVRVADQEALLRYAYGAAGTVGLLMCRLLGVTDPRALPHALDLGVAMQLTNIARDVAEDSARDRVYLPATWLPARGLAEPKAAFGAVARVLRLAEPYYRSGQLGLVYLPWRPRLAIGAAAHVYREIGQRILRAGPGYLAAPRCVVPQGRRLMVLARSLLPSLLQGGGVDHDARLHDLLRGEHGVHAQAQAERAVAE